MKNSEIAKILRINKSTVSRIIRGSRNYSKWKIERVLHYKNFEKETVEGMFRDSEFANICEFVMEKATNRDAKNYDEVIRFASQCLRWCELLVNNKNLENVESMIVTSLTKEPMELFVDPLFWQMMNVVLRKSKSLTLKQRAAVLQDSSENIRRITK